MSVEGQSSAQVDKDGIAIVAGEETIVRNIEDVDVPETITNASELTSVMDLIRLQFQKEGAVTGKGLIDFAMDPRVKKAKKAAYSGMSRREADSALNDFFGKLFS